MSSTKKHRKKTCLKCGTLLSTKNWPVYDQKIGYYICKQCRKSVDEKYHQADSDYSLKQKNRYRMRRSAVILAYGNACVTCGEDDYSKLLINGNINYLYNNIVQKEGHRVTCYNCNKKPYTNKYALKYKIELIQSYGNCCQKCPEDRIERLTITDNEELLCYNCHMSELSAEKYEKEPG